MASTINAGSVSRSADVATLPVCLGVDTAHPVTVAFPHIRVVNPAWAAAAVLAVTFAIPFAAVGVALIGAVTSPNWPAVVVLSVTAAMLVLAGPLPVLSSIAEFRTDWKTDRGITVDGRLARALHDQGVRVYVRMERERNGGVAADSTLRGRYARIRLFPTTVRHLSHDDPIRQARGWVLVGHELVHVARAHTAQELAARVAPLTWLLAAGAVTVAAGTEAFGAGFAWFGSVVIPAVAAANAVNARLVLPRLTRTHELEADVCAYSAVEPEMAVAAIIGEIDAAACLEELGVRRHDDYPALLERLSMLTGESGLDDPHHPAWGSRWTG